MLMRTLPKRPAKRAVKITDVVTGETALFRSLHAAPLKTGGRRMRAGFLLNNGLRKAYKGYYWEYEDETA